MNADFWRFIVAAFGEHHGVFLAFVGAIGLIIGSFINVVAHRTPLIMMNEWRDEIGEFIAHDALLDDKISQQSINKIKEIYQSNQKLSLSKPRSFCPHCQRQIACWHNIPVISYVMLLGRCAFCHVKISPLYPATEMMSALISMLIAHHFGVSIQTVFALILWWYLLALSLIDIKSQLLPDRLLAPLGMMGLLVNVYGVFTTPSLAIWGICLGFVIFWLINVIFKFITRKDGMGLGDAKLLGVLGAWLGAPFLPLIVFIAALIGVIGGMISGRQKAFAFGPYLAVGGLISLIWGERLLAWYLGGF